MEKDQSDGSEDGGGAWGQAERAWGILPGASIGTSPPTPAPQLPQTPKLVLTVQSQALRGMSSAPGLEPSVEAGPPQGGRGSS